jgi:protocatechuate 3,4-dioxygenase beta subunit
MTNNASIITVGDQLSSLQAQADQPDILDYIQRVREVPEGATPMTVEGPFYLDTRELLRSDITEGRPGIPLELRIDVRDFSTGAVVTDAVVEVWQCDAAGSYSGHLHGDPNRIPETGLAHVPAADDSRFLRGAQVTDDEGKVTFRSIYPGFYFARNVHLHSKVHVQGEEVYVGQLYLPEEYNKIVETLPPYRDHRDLERMPNDDDLLYQSMGGAQLTMAVEPVEADRPESGFVATFTIRIAR